MLRLTADFRSLCGREFKRHLAAQHFSVAALLVRRLHRYPERDARTKQNNEQARFEHFVQSTLSNGVSLERLKEMKDAVVGESSKE